MKIIGIDCEMIGVYPNDTNSLARVSIVDEKGKILYDKYIRQHRRVFSYRTNITGIVRENLFRGKLYRNARNDVINIIRNSILIGHGIHHDLNILQISPQMLFDLNCQVRDTSNYGYFRHSSPNGTPSLKSLALTYLNWNIQDKRHDSVEDAHAAVMLYLKVRNMWESEIQWHKDWNVNYGEESDDEDGDSEGGEQYYDDTDSSDD